MSGTAASAWAARVRAVPDAVAVEQDGVALTFAALASQVAQVAGALAGLGSSRRYAILSENRVEYLALQLGSAHLGAVLACLNWRLTPNELQHCIDLVQPAVLLVSPRMADRLTGVTLRDTIVVTFGAAWDRLCAAASPAPCAAKPDAPWLLLYTGGTTGLPKAAVLSQCTELARMPAMAADLGLQPHDPILAWPPMFHMGGTEPALYGLLHGGRVIIEDGFQPARLARHLATTRFGWVSVMPGAVAALADAVMQEGHVMGVRSCGVMADLVAPADLARLTTLLDAPWCNSFGSTETGTPPLSAARIAVGNSAPDLGKQASPGCALRLLDDAGLDVLPGALGELAVRGPTLFSGYWQESSPFENGWFRMGDLFRQRPDGRYDFVDRAKYLIKSGGENIYPAEIERVLLTHPGVSEAVVIRQPDPRWGEVPVALVACRSAVPVAALQALCRAGLAGYKQPKRIVVVEPALLARTHTGKLPRAALERWAAAQAAA